MEKNQKSQNTKTFDDMTKAELIQYLIAFQRRMEALEAIKDFAVENNPGNEHLESLLEELEDTDGE